jgi:hypothetical protein
MVKRDRKCIISLRLRRDVAAGCAIAAPSAPSSRSRAGRFILHGSYITDPKMGPHRRIKRKKMVHGD